MTSKELADELKAQEYLESRGYKKFQCESCEGKGSKQSDSGRWWACGFCEGRGWNWIATTGK